MSELPYWKDPGIRNNGKCQSAQMIPNKIFPPKDPKRSWSSGNARPLQPTSSPKPSHIRKKRRKPIPKEGENQFLGISALKKLIAAQVLAVATAKGINAAIRYQIGEKRHSNERLNKWLSPSFPLIMTVATMVANRGAAAPNR